MNDQINETNDNSLMINSYIHPLIRPQFPPLIDPKDLISKSIIGNKPNRAPNAFIIYRKMYVREARNEGYCFPMTVLSSMVSQSWEKEPEEVKNYYKRLAKEAFNYRNELFPKPESKRKKRSNWNVISFDDVEPKKNSNSTPNVFKSSFSSDNNISVNQPELDLVNQVSTPELSHELSHESSTTTSPIIDQFYDIPIDKLNAIDVYYSNLLTSSNENWEFNSKSCEQQQQQSQQQQSLPLENYQQIQSCDQNFFQNQQFLFNDSHLNYYQVNPNVLPSSSPDVLGIFQCNDELATTLQTFDSTIPDNSFVNQQYYVPTGYEYYSFY